MVKVETSGHVGKEHLSFDKAAFKPPPPPEEEELPDGLLNDTRGLVAARQPTPGRSLGQHHLVPVVQIALPLMPRSHPALRKRQKQTKKENGLSLSFSNVHFFPSFLFKCINMFFQK